MDCVSHAVNRERVFDRFEFLLFQIDFLLFGPSRSRFVASTKIWLSLVEPRTYDTLNTQNNHIFQFFEIHSSCLDHTTMAIGDDGMDLLARVWERAPPSPHNTKDTAILIDSDSDDDSVVAIVVAPPATAANDIDAEGSKKPAAVNNSIAARSAASTMTEPMMLSSKSTTPGLPLVSQTVKKFSSDNTAAAALSFAQVAEAAADSATDASDTRAYIADLQSKFDSAQGNATAATTSSSVAVATSKKSSPWDLDDTESDGDDDPFDDIIMVGYPGDKKIKSSSGSTVVVAPAATAAAAAAAASTTTTTISKVKEEARVFAAARKVSLSPTNSNVSSTHSRTATPLLGESIPPPSKSFEDEDDDDDDDESNYTYATYLANQQSLAAITSSSANKPFRCNHCPEQFLTRHQVRQHAKTCKQRLELEKFLQMTTPPGGGDAATSNTAATMTEDADAVNNEKEPEGVEEVAEEPDEITYTRYSPVKLNFGKDHPG